MAAQGTPANRGQSTIPWTKNVMESQHPLSAGPSRLSHKSVSTRALLLYLTYTALCIITDDAASSSSTRYCSFHPLSKQLNMQPSQVTSYLPAQNDVLLSIPLDALPYDLS